MKGLEALQKPLSGPNGSKPPSASESVAGGDVTALDRLGGVAAVAMHARAHMAGERDDCRHGFYIRLVVVSNDRCGRDVRTGQGLPKKRFRTGPITFVAQEHINDLSVLIYRTIQVEFSLAPKAEHFVDGPFPSGLPVACADALRRQVVGRTFVPS